MKMWCGDGTSVGFQQRKPHETQPSSQVQDRTYLRRGCVDCCRVIQLYEDNRHTWSHLQFDCRLSVELERRRVWLCHVPLCCVVL